VTDHVSVVIPAGVADGQTVRVPGVGEAGVRGARPGDLLVRVRVAEHEFLHREGDDLHVMAVLNIAQAALGATVTVPGIEGDETVDVPAGTQGGDVVRLRGRGMPTLRGGRGDLHVHVRVEVPRKLDKRQRELLRELGETLGTGRGNRTPLERIKDWLGA
jgi:molecular chaperone DnaJ